MQTIAVNGVALKVVDCGAGLPLVLVHGFPLDHGMWAGQIAALAAHVRVIAPDLRGFGGSQATPAPVAMEQFADDLAALCDALGVTGPIVLAGLSMGGYIALSFWHKYAERLRGLVLCDTRAGADTAAAAAGRRETARRLRIDGLAPLLETMLPKLLSPLTLRDRPQVVEDLRRQILSANPEGLAAAAEGMARRRDFTDCLGTIDCPTLVVVGRDDRLSTPAEMRSMAGTIRGARLVEIDDAGHLAPLERPAQFNAAVLEFLGLV
ncbi:MAG: alpha/beta fold hydrolase [Thermoguttaceae bacterium]|jgi:pimeloyl-ACP methyl ester carboxylesterase